MRPSRSHGSAALWWRVLAVFAAFALIAGACGDDDGSDDASGDGSDTSDVTDDTDDTEGGGGEATSERIAELQENGITIGIANEVPFGYVGDDGEATGIAPDVARAVLSELGIEEVDAQVVEFGQLIGGLQAGQYDMIAAGMYITPERAAQISFTDPDYCVAESFAVAEGNPEGIETYQSFVENPDLVLAVAAGTVEVGYAEDAGVPASQMQEFADIDSMYAALEADEVDAASGTAATVANQVATRSGLESVEPFFPVTAEGEQVLPCGGYGFRNDDQELRDAFNDQLNAFREDGTTMEIITAYDDFSESDVEMANNLTLEDFLG